MHRDPRRPTRPSRRRTLTGVGLATLLAAGAVLATAPASVLAATTLNVPADFPTIQSAIAAAADGDTVLVGPGTYNERIDFLRKNITVRSSAGRATTIIDGGGLGVVVTMDADPGESPTLRGFTVGNGGGGSSGSDGGIDTSGGPALIEDNLITGNLYCGEGGGITAAFSAATIRNNTISGNRQSACSGGSGGGGVSIRGAGTVQLLGNVIENNQHGSWAGAISLFASGSAVIERNVIRSNSAGTSGGAIEIVNNSPARIRNNLFVNNSAQRGGAITVSPPSGSVGADIANNTFAGNTAASGSAIRTEGFARSVAIYNNLIVGAGPGGVIECDSTYSSNTPQISYNDVVATSGTRFAGVCAGLASNLDAAPTFVNQAAGDYHLAAGSAGIDAGTGIAAGAPADDIDGDVRPTDGDADGVAKVDIGFDETPALPPLPIAVAIDILPGISPNVIKLSGKGLTVTVGLLSTPTFDARTATTSSLCFGDEGAPAQRDCTLAKPAVVKDLDRDGDLDLSLVFDTAQTGIDAGDTQACLTGRVTSGRTITGCDAIVTR